ncbi:MAG: alkaline phosphatase D family protein [Alphaproteobacteria bacterium]
MKLKVGPVRGVRPDGKVCFTGFGELDKPDQIAAWRYRRQGRQWSQTYAKAMTVPFDTEHPQLGKIKDVKDYAALIEIDANVHGPYQLQFGYYKGELDDKDRISFDDFPVVNYKISNHNRNTAKFWMMSCNYWAYLWGWKLWYKASDEIYRVINSNQEEVDAIVHTGDFVYADSLRLLNQCEKYDGFSELYRLTMQRPHCAEALSKYPFFQAADDHEVSNNLDIQGTLDTMMTQAGLAAFHTYQAMHSPGFTRAPHDPKHCYAFKINGQDAFMLGTRLDRKGGNIIRPRDMAILKRWLETDKNKNKLIFSTVTMFPRFLNESYSGDNWNGFPGQRDELLTFIDEKRISKVTFMAGDVHFHLYTGLKTPNGMKIFGIISSSTHWPYPRDPWWTTHVFETDEDWKEPDSLLGKEYIPGFRYCLASSCYRQNAAAHVTTHANGNVGVKLISDEDVQINLNDRAGTLLERN